MEIKSEPIILVVDDEPSNLRVVGSLLADGPYRLSFAQSGAQALESIEVIKPSLVLLDVMMPEMNGYEVCRRLKRDPETVDISVVFLTAKLGSEDLLEGFKAGGVDYITKPFSVDELLARVHTHMQVSILTQKLKEANALKSDLMNMVAHDLKNPLSAICGLAEFLLESQDENADDQLTEAEQREVIADIHEACNNTLSLVKGLLNSQAIESGVIELQRKDFNFEELVAEVVDLNERSACIKKIQVNNNVNQNLRVNMDECRMREVLDNLISNAVKYSPIGKSVFIDACINENLLHFEVRDEGPGLSDDDKLKVFGKMQKLSAQPTGGEHSTGLGLAITKNLVERFGGRIDVESEKGKGATFYFDIPDVVP